MISVCYFIGRSRVAGRLWEWTEISNSFSTQVETRRLRPTAVDFNPTSCLINVQHYKLHGSHAWGRGDTRR